MRLQVVVGGQFGSEAKGHVTAQLVKAVPISQDVAVMRVAGPNAGHSVVDEFGQKWAFRQLPVSVVLPHDGGVKHLIAAGSEVDGDVLLDEIDRVSAGKIGFRTSDLIVDPQATIIEPRHKKTEADEALTSKVGSTAKGIGAARADRLMRTAHRVADDKWLLSELAARGVDVEPTSPDIERFDNVIIEGTQGFGLGLHGAFYPYATSSDCRAIDFLAMAGISPWVAQRVQVWVVARMFPIRVAGNSGPLASETSWEALGLPEEKTTVTQKVRRVGLWDDKLVCDAVRANGGAPTVRLAITMADQQWPELAGVTHRDVILETMGDFIQHVETKTDVLVDMVTTGPDTAAWL